ncbi:hypothetical protein [Leuconostoc mesenteroides]|nr:hypothetical protein [Leuconostoc mesenteroides]STY46359.1 Uncharacterised protein [Leuconostoc mesenteroides]
MQPRQEDVINSLLQQLTNLTYVNAQLQSVVAQYQAKNKYSQNK